MALVIGGLQSGGSASTTTSTISGVSTALQFVSTQASGSDGFKVTTNGARWHVGAGTTDYFSSNGTTIQFAGKVGFSDDVTVTGGKLVYLNVAGTAYVYNDNTTTFLASGSNVSINPGVGNSFITTQGFSLSSFTDDSATSGNRTVNKTRGKNSFAIAASTCVITNSFVAATSQVVCTLEFVDATLTSILTCIPAAGSFTVTGNAVAAAATKFSWTVIS